MSIVEINGQRVEIDGFMQMTPQQQQAAVDEIAQSLTQSRPQVQGQQIPPLDAPYDPVRGRLQGTGQGLFMGWGDELAALTGAIGNSWAGGYKQIFGGEQQPPIGEVYKDIRDAERRGFEQFAKEDPWGALSSEIGGGLLTGGYGLSKVAPVVGAKGLPAAAGLGAVQGGAYGYGKAEDLSSGEGEKSAIIGGLLGLIPGALLAGKAGIRSLLKPDAEHAKAVQTLLSADIPLTTSQVTGSRMMQDIGEGTLRKIPFVGTPLAKVATEQRQKFQGKVLKMAGFAEKDVKRGLVDDEAILRAERQFSKRYADRLGNKTVDLTDDAFINDLAKVSEKHSAMLPFQQRQEVDDIVSQMLDKATKGPMTGETYQSLRSSLGKKAWQMRQSKPEQAALYRDLTDALDDAFGRSVPGGTKDIRTDYGRFKQVKDTYLSSNSVEAAEGLLLPSGLSRRSKKQGLGLKDKEWRDLISAAHRVLPDKLPDSTTAVRNLFNLGLGAGGATALFNPSMLGVPAALLAGGRMASSALARGTGSNLLLNPLATRQYGLLANPLAQPFLQ